jgi:hypothetical protein
VIRLGLRLALAGNRWSLVPTALTAIAVAFGTAILLFALSFQPALDVRYDRGAWRDTPGSPDGADPATPATRISLTNDFVEGRQLARIDVAPLGPGAPIPPGLDRLPTPGEAFVSPALEKLIRERPASELGDRFGRIVGIIGKTGLRGPNELAVVNGMTAAELETAGSRVVAAFDSEGEPPTLDWIVSVIVVIAVIGAIAPVAVFVASATRLAAARRERRLVALRLCGATPTQVALLAAVDALLIAAPGALFGVGLFVILRPVVALFELERLTWFPEAIAPDPVQAALVVAAVPVVGVAAAVVSLRRMSISPLGVARRTGTKPPGRWRAVPIVLALLAFAASFALGTTILRDVAAQALGLSFFGIIAGIVIVGPLLTSLVGRVVAGRGGPISLLAGRHLIEEPRASFSGVAGVVMATFVASVFFGIIAYTNQLSGTARVALRSTTLYAEVPPGGGGRIDNVTSAVAGAGANLRLIAVREGTLPNIADPGAPGAVAWIVSCPDLLAAADLPQATCGNAGIHLVRHEGSVPDGATLIGHPPEADAETLRGAMTASVAIVPGVAVDRLLPQGAQLPFGVLPDLVIEPSAVEAAGLALRPVIVLVPTDGSPRIVEAARTALETAMPTSGPVTGAEIAAVATNILDELGRVISLGLVMVMAVAGAGLAVAVAGGLLDRRRPFALLRLSGVTLRELRAVLFLEAAAPLITIAAVSSLLGVAVCQMLLLVDVSDGANVPLPDASLALLVGGGVAGALAIVSAALPLVGPVTDLEETRFE